MSNQDRPEKCPACAAKRVHDVREWKDYHPLSGHGVTDGVPTHPEVTVAAAGKTEKPLFAARER